ncbi:MAG: hypothetical protein HYR60_07000 [Acidobacteria bacterium]|nr:hypothetical protein [Acidobacteriota bacterium]
MQAHSQARIVRKYFSFIDQIGRRLRDDPYGFGAQRTAPLTGRFPGLQQLFNSLVSASITVRKVSDRLVEDWNPFSQRMVLPDEKPPRMSELERNITLLPAYVQTFVEWSHEAVHVLALEPFFCGYRNITSRDDFVTWNLANEALGFWYADMVVTRAVREYVPGAEVVYNRCAVSNVVFHPEQAFQRAGLDDLDQILTVYAHSFLGGKSPLSRGGNYYSESLARQLRNFYLGARSNLGNWYGLLRQFDLFGGYYTRFCAKANLPSLWSGEVLAAASSLEFEDYVFQLGTKHLPAMAKLRDRQTGAVGVRRHIQTRAYSAWFLRQALAKDWILCLDKRLDEAAVMSDVDAYLDGLEAALDALARRRPLRSVVNEIQAVDKVYDRRVRGTLERRQAYIKYRYRLFPFFEPTDGIIGVSDQCSDLSKEEMIEVVRFVMKRFEWEAGNPRFDRNGVIDLLQRFVTATKARGRAELRGCYNRFMTHPEVLRTWSVRLSDISPSRNQFKEIVFEYT